MKKLLDIRLLLFVCLLVYCMPAMAQRDNVWAFGSRGGLDFSTTPPTPIRTSIDGYGEAAAAVSDYRGRLLFYTNGTDVWDSTNTLMPHGVNLTGQGNTSGVTTASTSQGTLIVPFPDSVYKYYIFSLTADESEKGGMLYYSILDMRLNNGNGDIITSKKGILFDSGLTEKLIGVSTEFCKVWMLVRTSLADTFKAYAITAAGISTTPVLSMIGRKTIRMQAGHMIVSPDKTKLVSCNFPFFATSGGWTELYDFDRITGRLSNLRALDSASCYYGASFSPNSSKLYVTAYSGIASNNMIQYDLSGPVITSMSMGGSPFSGLKMGPDNKIYGNGFRPQNDGRSISVINYPDNLGTACQYNLDGLLLPLGSRIISGISTYLPLVVPDTATSYDSVSACFDGTMLTTPPGCWDFTWNDGTKANSKKITTSGIYWVSYTGPTSCHYQIDTYKVWVPPVPAVGSLTGCKGANNSFAWIDNGAGDNNKYIYDWIGGAGVVIHSKTGIADTLFNANPGTYHIKVTIPNVCDTTFVVNVKAPNYSASFVVDTFVCEGEMIQFQNTSANLDNYIWYFGDGDSTDAQTPEHAYKPGTYEAMLVGNTPYPCFDTSRVNIHVDSKASGSFTKDRDSICVGQAITFYPHYTSFVDSVRWNYGDGEILSSKAEGYHVFDKSGTYVVSLSVSSPHCPDTSFSDTVTIFPYPLVNIGSDTTLCPNSSPIVLSNLAAADGYTYLWNTGETANEIVVNTPGIYWLKAINGLGCYVTDSIEIKRSCYLDIPNVFSPNGDDINDYFFPKENLSGGVLRFTMKIFNRWGQQIFETTNIAGRGWDGGFNGAKQEQGVYVYLIEVTFANGAIENFKGNVTLIK